MKEEKKTGAARTQPATRNEEWSDERLSEFLGLQPPASMPADYAVLLKAYRGMTADLFARFVPLFVAAGRDVNATLDNGSTILDHLSRHRRSDEYVAALEAAGARRGRG
ncbi:MAG: PA4642 family protein [Gammaproteobacteria bacterium]|nr:PA4642 family protein [Pseudomonadales bacterium]MCP5345257.1 PA4642 family protein [Pseudomonadales bacterium]